MSSSMVAKVLEDLQALGYTVYLGMAAADSTVDQGDEKIPIEVAEGRYQIVARVYEANFKYGKNGVPVTFYVEYNGAKHTLGRSRIEYPEDVNHIVMCMSMRAKAFLEEQELIENGHDVSGLRIFEDNNKTFPKFQKKYITDDEAVRMLADLLEYKTKVLANIAEAEANLRTIVKKVCDKS